MSAREEGRGAKLYALLCGAFKAEDCAAVGAAFTAWPRTLLCGVLAATCILGTGTLLGRIARQNNGEPAAKAVVQAQTAQRILSTGELVALFTRYSFAFADAAIDFVDVPKFDVALVYAVAAALPKDVKINTMAYSGRELVLSGTAPTAQSVGLFCVNLLLEERIARAVQHHLTEIDGGVAFSVTCTAAEHLGLQNIS